MVYMTLDMVALEFVVIAYQLYIMIDVASFMICE
jgi:hypothetical protein